MNQKRITKLAGLSLVVTLLSCGGEPQQDKTDTENSTAANSEGLTFKEITLAPKPGSNRWYTPEQVSRGKTTFQENCAVCHGANAEATSDWKTPDGNGHYPPPPLNGSAHAWHHPLRLLASTVYHGGEPVGGQMPAFKDTLSETEIIDVIASFQSYWSDEIYQRWLDMEKSARQ